MQVMTKRLLQIKNQIERNRLEYDADVPYHLNLNPNPNPSLMENPHMNYQTKKEIKREKKENE